MLTETQKSLLGYVRSVPEWQSAMIYEQLAVLNTSASRLAAATAYLEQGFADGKLRPDRYYVQDRIYRKDQNTDLLQNTASTIGQALAALEVLAVLSDTFQQDLQHSAQFAHGLYYNELETLCTKHGYTQEVAL